MGLGAFIRASMVPPIDTDALDKFEMQQEQVMLVIRSTLDAVHIQHISSINDPYLAIIALETRHGVNSGLAAANIIIKIVTSRYDQSTKLEDYVSGMQSLHNQLAKTVSPTSNLKLSDQILALFILISLPKDEFSSMIQQLLGDIENVTTDTVFKRLLTQAQMSNSSIESESTVAFNAQQANKSKSKADLSRVLPERTSNAKDALCTYPGHQYSLHSNGNCIAQNSKSSQDKSKSKNDVKSKPIGTLSDADKVRLFDKAASKATSDAATANAAVAMAALSTNDSDNEDIIELTTAYSLIASDPISQSTDMYIDSGTNRDIFKTRERFSELHSIFPVCIRSANGSDSLVATQAGTVSIDTYDEKNRVCQASIEDVLYCPEVAVNLISVSRLCDGGFSLHADADSMSFINSNGQKLYATRTAHSMELWAARVSINSSCGHSSIPISTSRTSSFNASADLMHQRLGHLHSAALRRFCSTHDLTKTCTSCILAKSHRHPFPSKLPQLSRILFRVHSDVVGPIQTLTCSGKKYFVTFIDEASRFNKVYLISKKSDVFECFRSYVGMLSNTPVKNYVS